MEFSKDRHLTLSIEAIGILILRRLNAVSEFFELLIYFVPILAKCQEDPLQFLGEGRIEFRVLVHVYVDEMTNGVFDLGGLGFLSGSLLYILKESLIEDRDWLNLCFDAD